MMTTKKYAVVYLPIEKLYSEVPVSWMTEDKKKCWWPKSVNASSYMLKGDQPNKHTWELHDIEVEAYCSTLESARKKAEDPSYLTSEEGLEYTGKGMRKKKTIIHSSSEESITPSPYSISTVSLKKKKNTLKQTIRKQRSRSTSTESIVTPPPSPPTKNNITKQSNHDQQLENIQEIISDNKNSTVIQETLDIDNVPIIISENTTTVEDLQFSIDRLTRICLDIQKNLQSLQKTMKSFHLERGNLEVDQYLKNLQDKLPLKSEEEIFSFDDFLKNDEQKQIFISYLKTIGGRDLKDNVNRCLAKIFTNGLAKNCSLQGKRGNLKLADTYAIKLFIGLMVLLHNSNSCEVQTHISEWFRLAKQRFNREK